MLRRKRRNIVLYCLCLLLGLTAYASLIVSLGIVLTDLYGLLAAPLIIAAACIGIALMILAGIAIEKRYAARNKPDFSRVLSAAAAASLASTRGGKSLLIPVGIVLAATLVGSSSRSSS